MNPFVLANWKMNGSKNDIERYCDELTAYFHRLEPHVTCVVFPPFPYIALSNQKLQHQFLFSGAQDCAASAKGAFTGDVAASMIRDCGGKYVIIGHSERRQYHHAENTMLADKLKQATKAGLTPVFCFGESLEEYNQGQQMQTCAKQLEAVFKHPHLQDTPLKRVILAYEPVWAIGSGLTPNPIDVQNLLEGLNDQVLENYTQIEEFSFVYGGSVNEANFQGFISQPLIKGALVGGASLKTETFIPLIEIANQ